MITAIIPALNEEEFIEECLVSLKNQTYPIDEIIVVDSGSTDRTVEIAGKYADKILIGLPNIGYNRELGMLNARNQIILSTDADTIFPENWIEEALKYFNYLEVVAVQGSIKPLNINLITRINCWFRNLSIIHDLTNRGCCFLFKNSSDVHFCNKECYSFGEISTLKSYLMQKGEIIYDKNLFVLTNIPQKSQFKTAIVLGSGAGIIWEIANFMIQQKLLFRKQL